MCASMGRWFTRRASWRIGPCASLKRRAGAARRGLPPELRGHYAGKLQLAPNVPKGAPEEYARQVLPDYYGMVESLDIEFQRILEALDRAGVAEDTIVCYSWEH